MNPDAGPSGIVEVLSSQPFRDLLRALVVEEIERLDSAAAGVPEWLTVEEAAARYRLSPAALRKRAQRDQVLHVHDGRRLLFDRRALDTELERAMMSPYKKTGGHRVNGPAPAQEV